MSKRKLPECGYFKTFNLYDPGNVIVHHVMKKLARGASDVNMPSLENLAMGLNDANLPL